MGLLDTVTKTYIRENAIFADAFNYLIYNGEQIIKPEHLQPEDITEISIPFNLDIDITASNFSKIATQKYRDILNQQLS